jgi:hypothetical protein
MRLVFSLYWLFILPGYFLLLMFMNKIGFFERLVAATLVGATVIGVVGYYLGLLTGLHVKYYHYFLPLVLMVIGYILYIKEEKRSEV